MVVWIVLLVVIALVIFARTSRREAPEPRTPDDDEDAPGAAPAGPAVMPIEDSIDLHTFAPRDIPSVVEAYLEAALERGFVEVRLIHGRGKGVQRARVREILGRHPAVADFRDAPPSRGGYGATLVWFKPSPR